MGEKPVGVDFAFKGVYKLGSSEDRKRRCLREISGGDDLLGFESGNAVNNI